MSRLNLFLLLVLAALFIVAGTSDTVPSHVQTTRMTVMGTPDYDVPHQGLIWATDHGSFLSNFMVQCKQGGTVGSDNMSAACGFSYNHLAQTKTAKAA